MKSPARAAPKLWPVDMMAVQLGQSLWRRYGWVVEETMWREKSIQLAHYTRCRGVKRLREMAHLDDAGNSSSWLHFQAGKCLVKAPMNLASDKKRALREQTTKSNTLHLDIGGEAVKVWKREGEVDDPIGDVWTASKCQNNGGIESVVADIALNT